MTEHLSVAQAAKRASKRLGRDISPRQLRRALERGDLDFVTIHSESGKVTAYIVTDRDIDAWPGPRGYRKKPQK